VNILPLRWLPVNSISQVLHHIENQPFIVRFQELFPNLDLIHFTKDPSRNIHRRLLRSRVRTRFSPSSYPFSAVSHNLKS
jgi:hypothetical protein